LHHVLEIGLHLRIASGPAAREAVWILRSTALMGASLAAPASAANLAAGWRYSLQLI
jgi:hypothetical protein